MISIIVAVDKNLGIGANDNLLAHIPEDLKYFKEVTNGKVVVMGYTTYLSLPKRPLINRVNIVLSQSVNHIEGAIVLDSIASVLDYVNTNHLNEEIFIIGGASVYKQFMPYADKLYITHILHEFEADTFFCNIDDSWVISETKVNSENIIHKYPHIFTIYKKKSVN